MKILVVEDEAAIREVEVAYLKKAGYDVVDTDNGVKAIELFEAHRIDAIILDLNLPGKDGLDVCRNLREYSNVPILIVTARNSDDDEIKGLEIGADDYLRKPFNPKILVARVQALLRNRGGSVLQFGELIINPEAMTIEKKGVKIELTTTRFNLLLTLASQPNTVLSRQQLVERVYADASDHFVYERTIDAHIKAIRKLIEEDPKDPHYIQTVIGTGYKFNGGIHAR